MALGADVITLATLTGVSSSGQAGQAFDLSGYSAGLLVSQFTAAGSSLTLALQLSPDEGTTWANAPAGIIAAMAAVTTTGVVWYTFAMDPIVLPDRARIAWSSVTGTFTGVVKAYMRR
jgi:hypothetical protein